MFWLFLQYAFPSVAFDESQFFQSLHQVMDTPMIPKLSENFAQQIQQGCTQQHIGSFVKQLPFEPDNLRTGDCTFAACCSVLILNKYLTSQDPEALVTLTHIAVLTYFRHSTEFFTSIFEPALSQCAAETGTSLPKTAAEYYQDMRNGELEQFTKYRLNILQRMTRHVNTLQIPDQSTPQHHLYLSTDVKGGGKSLKILYKSGPSADKAVEYKDSEGLKQLIAYTHRTVGHLVVIDRTFDMRPGQSTETGTVTLLDPTTMQASLSESITYTQPSNNQPIQVARSSTATISPTLPIDTPVLVLQIPQVVLPSSIESYLTSSEKVSHNVEVCPGLVIQETATRHAIVTSFNTTCSQNTWMSGARGLKLGAQNPLLKEWVNIIVGHFKIKSQLK